MATFRVSGIEKSNWLFTSNEYRNWFFTVSLTVVLGVYGFYDMNNPIAIAGLFGVWIVSVLVSAISSRFFVVREM